MNFKTFKKSISIASFLIYFSLPSLAWGATFNVTKTADTSDGTCDADCSLREAIIAANTSSGADTIDLPTGTYTLSIAGVGEDATATGDLDIADDLTIIGDGASSTIIDGGGIDRVLHILTGIMFEISDVTIQNGELTSPSNGGGILNSGNTTLMNVIVKDNAIIGILGSNDAGGGIFNAGTITITHCTISGNSADRGGGIFNPGSATLTINESTISGNSSRAGGGFYTLGNSTITNSTIGGNSATNAGGGMIIEGDTTIVNCTITGNSAPPGLGGGISNVTNLTMINTVVTDNTGDNCLLSNNITSNGHNIDSDGTCVLMGPGDLSNTDPLLGPLQDNGGPTFTHALLSGSPAIDAGDDAGAPSIDQRGISRPQDGDGDGTATTDIGAYEAEPPRTTPTLTSGRGGCSIIGDGKKPTNGLISFGLLLVAALWFRMRTRSRS